MANKVAEYRPSGTDLGNGRLINLQTNSDGDLYIAGVSKTTNTLNAAESNPISMHYEGGTLCDLSSIAANTTDYAGYIDMAGKRTLGLHIITGGTAPTDTITVTIEATIQDDGTAPASCEYEDVTNDWFGVASLVDDNALWISTNIPVKYVRVKYVTSNDGGDDQSLKVFYKTLY